MTWMTAFFLTVCGAVDVEPPVSALLAIETARLSPPAVAMIAEFQETDHWRARSEIAKRFPETGQDVVTMWLLLVEQGSTPKVRSEAFTQLRRFAPDHPRLKEYVLRVGLVSPENSIRYESQFLVGTQRWTEARPVLWQQLTDRQEDEQTRNVAAKSLGELGDRRALRRLIQAVQHDRFYPRYFGNLGLKGLCGKDLTDFGYDNGEGAFVSVVEATILNPDPLFEADRRAKRFTALRDFLKWLQEERPELYTSLTEPTF